MANLATYNAYRAVEDENVSKQDLNHGDQVSEEKQAVRTNFPENYVEEVAAFVDMATSTMDSSD